MTRQHHQDSPSTLKRRRLCPGSGKLECMALEFMPEELDNTDARRGTLLHAAVGDPTVRRESVDITDLPYLEATDDYLTTKWPGSQWIAEQHVEVKSRFGSVLTAGWVDLHTVLPDKTIVLVDFKFGFKPQDGAADNDQLRAYAAGLLQLYPDATAVHAYLVQPPLHVFPDTPDVFTRADIPALVGDIAGILSKAHHPTEMLLEPGEHCQYCRAKQAGMCPAYSRHVNEMIARKPQVPVTAENAVSLYRKMKTVEEYFATSLRPAIEQAVKDAGGRVEDDEGNGLCFTKPGRERHLPEPSKVIRTLLSEDLITPGEADALLSLSPAKVESLIHWRLKDRGAVKNKQETADWLARHATVTETTRNPFLKRF